MAYFKLNSGCVQLDSWIISLYWTRIEAGPSSGVQNSPAIQNHLEWHTKTAVAPSQREYSGYMYDI